MPNAIRIPIHAFEVADMPRRGALAVGANGPEPQVGQNFALGDTAAPQLGQANTVDLQLSR
jgi:hypothetical protein